REGLSESAAGELLHERGIGEELAGRALPHRPRARRAQAHAAVAARQALVVGAHHVPALLRRDRLEVGLPHVGEDLARAALLVEPLELALAQEEDAAQRERLAARRVRLGVGERERAAPATAEDDPA